MANAKKYDDLTFTDDFMFCKVMTTNPELCQLCLHLSRTDLDTTQKSLIFLDASLLAIVFLMQLTKLPMQ